MLGRWQKRFAFTSVSLIVCVQWIAEIFVLLREMQCQSMRGLNAIRIGLGELRNESADVLMIDVK